MTIPTFNVGGLASGLDTNSIVAQLVELERIPIYQMESRQATYEKKDAAWQTINTRLSALHDTINDLDTTSDWSKFVSGTSSNDDVASVSVSGSAPTGSISFTVDRLATTHQITAATDFGSGTDLVGAGTLTLNIGGTEHTVDTNSATTLNDLASQINRLDAGVTAGVVAVDGSTVKLVVSAGDSGAANSFTASGTQPGLGTFDIVEQAVDAQLTIGSGAGALIVERASNTVSDLMAGVTIDLKATSTTATTVSVGRDEDAVVEKVQAFVDELNSTLTTISDLTKYNATADSAGALQGDSAARGILFGLRSEISKAVEGLTGSYTYAGSVGISINRDGSFSFDESELRDALADDFNGVMDVFARNGSSTDSRVGFGGSTTSTVDGTYGVTITQAASVASVTGTAFASPGSDEVFQITSGSEVVDVTITAGSTVAEAVQAINDALDSAGVTTLNASESGGAIALTDSVAGSGSSFTVTANAFGLAGTFTGTDVAGTIGGNPATGTGTTLTATSGDAQGISISVGAGQSEVDAAAGSLALGTVTVHTGFMKRMEEYLDTLEGTGGVVDRARDAWQNRIDYVEDRIADMELRLELREVTLRRRYTALETAMNQLSALAQQVAMGLSGLQQPQQ